MFRRFQHIKWSDPLISCFRNWRVVGRSLQNEFAAFSSKPFYFNIFTQHIYWWTKFIEESSLIQYHIQEFRLSWVDSKWYTDQVLFLSKCRGNKRHFRLIFYQTKFSRNLFRRPNMTAWHWVLTTTVILPP